MPRYLTPARICLLVLIRLYQFGQVSQESSLFLLDFIAGQITAQPQNDEASFHERNEFSSCDISFLAERLTRWSSRFPGRNMHDVLLQALWQLPGLNMLQELFTQPRLVGVTMLNDDSASDTIKIGPASPIGQFVRRCYVEFTRLQFADSQSLWSAFAAYRSPTFDEWAMKNPDAAAELQYHEAFSSLPVSSAIRPGADISEGASVVDADLLLGFAIHQLQKIGTRVPEDVKTRLDRWITDQLDSGTQSLHYFMAFFEHWRAGEYTMALESLHKYFDYSLAARSGEANMRVYYQYALLHLSVLHADFECWGESVDAMNECIATARENQDTACLNFALSWLLYLRHARPEKTESSFETISGIVGSNGSEHDEIAFLKQKAREGKHWLLMSSTLLEEAKLEMYTGESTNRAHEHILQAMYLNIHHAIRSLAPATSLFHGASLDRIGQAHLASRQYDLANSVHFQYCPLNDRVRSSCRVALTLGQAGLFSKAMKTLSSLAPVVKGVMKLEQRVKAFVTLIELRRQLHRGDNDSVDYHLSQLRPFRSFSDPEVAFEATALEIEALIKRKLYVEALAKVGVRLRELKGRGSDFAQRLHLLILKARIFAVGGQATKGFAIALRATSTAERHLLLPCLLDGLWVLGKILTELGEFETAREVVSAALPHALEGNNISLVARLFVVMGEACVGFAGTGCAPESPEQKSGMRRAQELIGRGRTAYQRTEDLSGQLDCLAMKSRIAAWDGDEISAAQADEMYYQLLADRDEGTI